MPELFYSPASPYSAKVRMAAQLASIDLKATMVATGDEPAILINANPMGKIPTLVLDNGEAVFDSKAICQELDRLSGKTLFPRNGDKRREAERLEAAADGLCDALLAHVYERRFRPAQAVQSTWLELQMRKAVRTLDWLETNISMRGKAHCGHLAVIAALGYADLRFPELKWSKGRPKLKRFAARFDEKYPEIAALAPKA